MDKILMKLEAELPVQNLVLTEKHFARGEEFPPHWHDYFEWELLTGGRAEQICNGHAFSTEAGDSYLLSYSDFHSFRAVTDVSLLSVRFDEKTLPAELASHLRANPAFRMAHLSAEESARLSHLWETVHAEVGGEGAFAPLRASALLTELLISFLREARETEPLLLPDAVQRTVSVLHKSFRSPLTLTSVAEELHLSPNHLGMIFHRSVGVPFARYLGSLRLRYACELLRTSALTAREIAFAAGYGSAEYFAAVFRRDMGMTAGEYRKKHRKDATFP